MQCWGADAATHTAAFAGSKWRQLTLGKNGEVCAIAENATTTRCLLGGSSATDITETNGFRAISQYQSVLCRAKGDGKGSCNGVFLPSISSTYWHAIEGGLLHACGLRLYSDVGNTAFGTPTCWGDNSQGQLSNIYTGTARAISTGYNHACVIAESGQLVCWGSNVSGQTDAPSGEYVQVAAGNTFTCAIRDNGTRVCWGDDAQGQAPQLSLSPSGIANGQLGVAHAGANFALTDVGTNADGDYVPPSPVFYADPADLPPGLSLSAAGVLSGTPTASGTFTFTVEGEDANGFTASSSYTVTIIADSTPPQIGYTLTPAAPDGSNGWYVSDIGIDWTVSDAESSVSGIIGCVDEALNTDTPGTTRSCTASSLGGSASLTTEVLKRDATAPTLAPTTPSPLLRGQSYVASPNASDATSGIASSSCGALDTSTLGEKSLACNARDNAGNTNEAELAYTVTTTCVNDGYKNTQLNWCKQICESGLTGKALDTWIHRWVAQFHDLPYCRVGL